MIREDKEYIVTQGREYLYREYSSGHKQPGLPYMPYETEMLQYAHGWVMLDWWSRPGARGDDMPIVNVGAYIYLISTDTSYIVAAKASGEMELKIKQYSDGSRTREQEEFGSAWRWMHRNAPPLIMGEISEAYRELFNQVIHKVLPASQDPAYQEAIKGLPIYRELA